MTNVRITELSEPIKNNERFIVETKTLQVERKWLWGLFTTKANEYEVPKMTMQIPVAFSNYEEAEVAAKRWLALVNPTYHYIK